MHACLPPPPSLPPPTPFPYGPLSPWPAHPVTAALLDSTRLVALEVLGDDGAPDEAPDEGLVHLRHLAHVHPGRPSMIEHQRGGRGGAVSTEGLSQTRSRGGKADQGWRALEVRHVRRLPLEHLGRVLGGARARQPRQARVAQHPCYWYVGTHEEWCGQRHRPRATAHGTYETIHTCHPPFPLLPLSIDSSSSGVEGPPAAAAAPAPPVAVAAGASAASLMGKFTGAFCGGRIG